ncbi:MAG: chitobiase/beta-hexosaminidase C-terminal domain-containing protein [Bacteroidales bacterium]|nr:chitobiase/beta-hexosaminidase C-terminal domain-containing protein [Bacteroidales bacterium]
MKAFKQLLVLGALVLPAACQQEPVPQLMDTVTFRVAFPDDTKAAGDGSHATVLTLRIYDADGQFLQELTPNTFTPSVTLVQGTYSFIFWATSPDADAYSFDGQVLTVDYSRMTMNSDEEDAFWACVPNLTVSPGFTRDVTLRRPLGQVSLYSKDSNPALTATDLNDAGRFVSSFTLQGPAGGGIPTRMNLLTGATSEPVAQVAFPDSPLQLQTLESATDGTLLAFAYVLAPEDALTLSQVDFSATLKRTQATLASGSVASVPLQRNHRTRLLFQPQAQLDPPTISFKDDNGDPWDALDETHSNIWVNIQGAQGATIYYTLDGTTPTETSLKYEDPFPVYEICTIKAIAVKAGRSTSEIAIEYVQKHISEDDMGMFYSIQIGSQDDAYSFYNGTVYLLFGDNENYSDNYDYWEIQQSHMFSIKMGYFLNSEMITRVVLSTSTASQETHFETMCVSGGYQDSDYMVYQGNTDIWTGQAKWIDIIPLTDYACNRVDIWYTEVQL